MNDSQMIVFLMFAIFICQAISSHFIHKELSRLSSDVERMITMLCAYYSEKRDKEAK